MDSDDDDKPLLSLVAWRHCRQAVMVLLYNAINQPRRPLVPDVRFHLSDMTDANSRLDFRFDVAGVQQLFVAHLIPDVEITRAALARCAWCCTVYRPKTLSRQHGKVWALWSVPISGFPACNWIAL
jgi:hypothetical protein